LNVELRCCCECRPSPTANRVQGVLRRSFARLAVWLIQSLSSQHSTERLQVLVYHISSSPTDSPLYGQHCLSFYLFVKIVFIFLFSGYPSNRLYVIMIYYSLTQLCRPLRPLLSRPTVVHSDNGMIQSVMLSIIVILVISSRQLCLRERQCC